MNLLVVFGAGASFDVSGPGNTVLNGRLRPPLASHLFEGRFAEELRRYPGAATLAQRLAGTGGTALESRLREYSEHSNQELRDCFKGLPPYFHDLLSKCTAGYVDFPGAYSSFVVQAAGETSHNIMAISLNYDCLFERALTLYRPSVYRFSNLDEYCADNMRVKVVKPHGSVTWRRSMGDVRLSWDRAFDEFDLSAPLDHSMVRVSVDSEPIADVTHQNQRWYPVLTAPLAGKKESDFVCPDSHIQALRAFAPTADKIAFIGTSGYDDHVLGVITNALGADWRGLVQFVGDHTVTDVAARIEVAIPQVRPKQARPSWTFAEGFASYTRSDAFREFLQVRV